MLNTILFLGKFHEELIDLQEKVINLSNNLQKTDQKIIYDQKQMPDVIKYQIKNYNCDVWTIINDVKPTLLLKDLISKSQIILFFFYFSEPETLKYLVNGWGPIIDRVDKNKPKNQERLLIGITGKNSNRYEIEEEIRLSMKKLSCTQYYEEGTPIKPSFEKVGSFPIRTNLIEYINNQVANKSIKRSISRKILETPSETKGDFDHFKATKPKNSFQKQFSKSSSESSEYKTEEKVQFKEQLSNKLYLKNTDKSQINDKKSDTENNDQKQVVKKSSEDLALKNVDDDFEINEIEIKINNSNCKLLIKQNTAKIIDINDNNNLSIPDSISYKRYKYQITEIGDYCFKNSAKLNSITFSNQKITLCDHCFDNCGSLSSITFTNVSVIKTNSYSFEGCKNLKKIKIDSETTLEIKEGSFFNIPSLNTIEIKG